MPESTSDRVDRGALLASASRLTELGISTVPVGNTSGKVPTVKGRNGKPVDHERDREHNVGWEWRRSAPPGGRELQRDYANYSTTGIGVICGAVSGNLQLVEFEKEAVERGLDAAFLEAVEERDPDLASTLKGSWWNVSPTNGRHLVFRLSEGPVPGNTKLASRPPSESEIDAAHLDGKQRAHNVVLIETRGEGGYFVGPGSLRPDYASDERVVFEEWSIHLGGPDAIAVVTPRQNAVVFEVARSFDEMPRVAPRVMDLRADTPTPDRPVRGRTRAEGERPGDIFNREATWTDVLSTRRAEGQRWSLAFHDEASDVRYWRKPGSSDPWHATTNVKGTDRLIVFSTATDFDGDAKAYESDEGVDVRHTSYSKFEAETILGGYAEHPPNIEPDDESACAKALMAEGYVSAAAKFFGSEGLKLRSLADAIEGMGPLASDYGGGLWFYDDGVWRRDGNREVGERTQALLDERMRRSHKTNALDWFANRHPDITDNAVTEYINFTNGLLRWETGELVPHDPSVMSTIQLPHMWDPDAQCPTVDEWIGQVIRDDCAELVWQIIGYAMYDGNPLHRAVMLLGNGRNGKGTLLRLIGAMLGRHNVSSVSLQSLVEDRFAAAELFGKAANLAGDLDARALKATDLFKQVTGGDSIPAQRKYGQPFSFIPRAVPIFAANEMPKTPDLSVGFFSRWLIVPFETDLRRFGIDPGIENRLHAEIQGVIAKGVHALQHVMTNKDFTIPLSVHAEKEAYRTYSNPVAGYIDERIEPAEGKRVSRALVYSDFSEWTRGNGGRGLGAKKFHGRFRARLEELGIPYEEPRYGDGYYYRGVFFSSGGER